MEKIVNGLIRLWNFLDGKKTGLALFFMMLGDILTGHPQTLSIGADLHVVGKYLGYAGLYHKGIKWADETIPK